MKRTGKDIKSWVRKHREELKVGAVGAAVVFFFTHGLPLFDDDYGKWLAQADASFGNIIQRLILPFTTDVQNWGFKDRPGEVLIYKILYSIFGDSGAGFYFAKSLAFGGLTAVIYRALRRNGHDTFVSRLSIALFILSTSTVATMILHSDFAVYSQLILAAVLFWALPHFEKSAKIDPQFVGAFFAAVYFGSKVRGDVRLAPVVLLAYLYIYRRERFRVHAPALAATLLASLPWSLDMLKQRPQFFPNASGFLSGVVRYLFDGALNLSAPSISVISATGALVVGVAIVFAAYRIYAEKLKAPDYHWGFFLVWFGAALVVCGVMPADMDNPFRYTFMALVPATFLIAMTLNALFHEFPQFNWIRHAALVVVILQSGVHFYHDAGYRKQVGHARVAAAKVFAEMETKNPNGQFLYVRGFGNYGYKAQTSQSVAKRAEIANIDDIGRYPAGSTYVATWVPTLDVRFTVADAASGCNDSLFDKVFACTRSDSAVIWKYVGTPPETATATDYERKGDIAGARRVLEGYLQKEPGNYGVAFMLSLYAYRQGDYARMEQLYDAFGPHFMGYPAVVYNWGLAKQGMQKFSEATRYLELANHMVPGDYGIGFNLADTYFRAGRKTRALATLGEVMKKYPNDPAMRRSYEEWSKK